MAYVVFVNGLVLLLAAALMAVDALFFPLTRGMFAISALVTGTVGGCLAITAAGSLSTLLRRHTFLLTGTIWLVAALAGALPLYLWGLTPTDAFFEAMSGITTTGSTVMSGLDTTDRGILFWRAILQWIGGVGFIVTGMALLPILKVGGMQLFRTESSDRSEKELSSATRFASATIYVYVGLSALCMFTYVLGGMSGFDAATHAMTTVSTGGYSTYDASFGHFDSGFLQWSAIAFMLSGALPFAWYIRAINRNVLRSEQVRAFLLGLVVVILGLTAWRVILLHDPLALSLREVAFNVVSVVTTTGYATTDYTLWGPVAVVGFFLLTAAGGCTGSTSGGAKTMRWILFVRGVRIWIRQIHSPNSVSVMRYEGRPVDPDVVDGIVTFFMFYTLTTFLMAFALLFTGLDLTTSLSGALTALANVGPGIGETIGPAGNFSTLPDSAKWILCFGMYVGRLEMLTVYVLLTRKFWVEAW